MPRNNPHYVGTWLSREEYELLSIVTKEEGLSKAEWIRQRCFNCLKLDGRLKGG